MDDERSNRSLDDFSRRLYEVLSTAASLRTNETELREDAEPVIREALDKLYGMSALSFTAERRSRRGGRRQYDKLFGGVVVEWEWGGESRRFAGAKQALEYLSDVRADPEEEDAFTAVVCDGTKWGFLAIDPGGPQLDLFQADLKPKDRFEWHDNSPSACRRFLELVASHRKSPITARRLAEAFGPSATAARQVVGLLSEALAGRSKDDRSDTLYREWRRSLDVAYGDLDAVGGELAFTIRDAYDVRVDRSVGEYLFVVHTYFALVARLIAVEVLAISSQEPSSQPTNWEPLDDPDLVGMLSRLENGDIPSGLDIQNLFEGDVFSWYLDAATGNVDLLNGFRQLMATMSTFAFPRVAYGANPATDVLRDLYQVLVPRSLRRSLGEFLTPHWLAESCLVRLREVGADLETGRTLDPTCGTGTFLMPVVKERLSRLRASHGGAVSAREVRLLLESVAGFDINPVAVIAARVNMLLALGDLAAVGPITLPIWRTDSILLPDETLRQSSMLQPRLVGKAWMSLATSLPDPFAVPPLLATAQRMGVLRRALETAMGEADRQQGQEIFIEQLEYEFGAPSATPITTDAQEWADALEVCIHLYDQVRDLADEGRNGVWARIIENSFAPLFTGRFSVIVGNPPWLTWTRLPERWRAATERIWRRYGLWQIPKEAGDRARSQLASTDMAVLVFATALDRYLEVNGVIGLLTPDSLLTGDPGGRAFRRFRLTSGDGQVDLPFRVLHVDNWADVGPFRPDASNRPVFIAARRDESAQYPVPTVKWRRGEGVVQLAAEWAAVKLQLEKTPGSSAPVDRQSPTSAWSFQALGAPALIEGGRNNWEFGKGLDTRGANGVFFVQILQSKRAEGSVLIENGISGRDPTIQITRGWVEADLVYPLLRGRDVQPWSAQPSCYIIAPYKPGLMGELLDEPTFRTKYSRAWRWLRRHRDTLTTRKAPPTRSWDIAGRDWARLDGPLSHMRGQHIVVVREQQQRPAAAVVQARFDEALGRTTGHLVI